MISVAAALHGCAAFLLSLVACASIRSLAARYALVDKPNERSLHTVPTPRLGGVGIAVAVWLVVGVAMLAGFSGFGREVRIWAIASIPVAALGLIDDVRPIPAIVRLVIQVAVSAAFIAMLDVSGSIPFLHELPLTLSRGAVIALGTFWIVAVLNIYNFMDGMDGIAGSQGTFAGLGWLVIAMATGRFDLAIVAAALAGANAGFLVHNAPPASIFMGDAGSTFLGFSFAAFGLTSLGGAHPVPFIVAPVLLGPFLLDGVFTLLRRALRGENVLRAHRTHLYQRAVQTGLAHRDVLMPYAGWFSVCLAAGCFLLGAATVPACAVVLALVASLLGVRAWVVRREKRAAAQSS